MYGFLLREKCPYSELFWSPFFPKFPTFRLDTERYEVGKCGKNVDHYNSEYGCFLRSVVRCVFYFWPHILIITSSYNSGIILVIIRATFILLSIITMWSLTDSICSISWPCRLVETRFYIWRTILVILFSRILIIIKTRSSLSFAKAWLFVFCFRMWVVVPISTGDFIMAEFLNATRLSHST